MGSGEEKLAGLLARVLALSLLSTALVLLRCANSAELRAHASGVFLTNLSLGHLLLAALDLPFVLLRRTVGFLDTFLASSAALIAVAPSAEQWLAVGFPLLYARRLRPPDARLRLAYAWTQSLAFAFAVLASSPLGYSSSFAPRSLRLPGEPESRRFTACPPWAWRCRSLCSASLAIGASGDARPLPAHRRGHHAGARAAPGPAPREPASALGPSPWGCT